MEQFAQTNNVLTSEQIKALKIDIDCSDKLLQGGAEAVGAVGLGGLCNL